MDKRHNSGLKLQIPIEKLKIYQSSGTDQTSEELIQLGGKTVGSEIHKS
jgi:hypothetical protein